MEVKIKRFNPEAIIPSKSTEGSIAFDLYVPFDYLIAKGRQVVPLEFGIEMDAEWEAKIEPRSGFSSKGIEDKDGVRRDADVLVGKVDSDYRGCVGVIVKSNETFVIGKGTKIAQMTFYHSPSTTFVETDELSATNRKGGFGSTGK